MSQTQQGGFGQNNNAYDQQQPNNNVNRHTLFLISNIFNMILYDSLLNRNE